MSILELSHRVPVGAHLTPEGGVHFRVWCPRRSRVEVVIEAGPGAPAGVSLAPEAGGYFSGIVRGADSETKYRYRVDGEGPFPDPASRFQPDGPHGPSEVIDPTGYRWSDAEWKGVARSGHVIYELHVGTFTGAGTWAAATAELSYLADLGITLIESMPVGDFPGRFGWGYDGVNLYAPSRLYGGPDDFRRFVDRAHSLGIGVILDVVYNHLGPDGNYLPQFSHTYLSQRFKTEWGDPLNYSEAGSAPVRELIIANAAYWIREFHLDGLRLDATQSIHDTRPVADHILTDISRAARAAAGDRTIYVVAENEPQDTTLLRPIDAGGNGLDALWNDDFHHAAMVALTGRKEAYYTDYQGAPQEFVSAAKWGFLYQGQFYSWQDKRRGTPALDLPTSAFVGFLQNHDQVANSARGERVHERASPSQLRAMTALALLGTGTPMLFMGQEFAASTPFHYFADHRRELAAKVYQGRREFLEQFPSLALPELQAGLSDPADPEVFRRCKLDFGDREVNREILALHRDLIRLRRQDPVLRSRPRGLDGAVLSSDAFVLRFFGESIGDDRLLIVNLGRDLTYTPAPEPLLAPPHDARWAVLWASEHPDYGGSGAPPPVGPRGAWEIAGEAAIVLSPKPIRLDD